jgi:hypothetical protein
MRGDYFCNGPTCCCQHVNGQVETTVYFSGNWIIAHYPAPEFWPAQGHFYSAEQHYQLGQLQLSKWLWGAAKRHLD